MKKIITIIDITNKNPDNTQMHFGKFSKVNYRDGFQLALKTIK